MASVNRIVTLLCLTALAVMVPVTALSETFTVLEAVRVQWWVDPNGLNGQEEIVMSLIHDHRGENSYAAVGYDSPSAMDGPIVVCGLDVSNPANHVCQDYDGVGLDIAKRTTHTTRVVSSVMAADNTWNITFRRPTNGWVSTGENRVIFAWGEWIPATQQALEHPGHDAFAAKRVDFAAETLRSTSTGRKKIAIIVFAIVFVLGAVTTGAVNFKELGVTPLVNSIVTWGCVLIFLAMLFLFTFMTAADYDGEGTKAAMARGFGEGCAFLFWFILYPVTRRFVFPHLMGIPFERAVKFHIVVGLLLFVWMTIHMAMMWNEYGFGPLWHTQGQIMVLPGTLSYILTLLVVITALLRFKMWEVFVSVHFLYVAIIVLATIHYPPTIYGAVPALALYFLDFVLRVMSNSRIAPVVSETHYDAGSGIATLTVSTNTDYVIEPGQYFFVNLPSLSRLQYHPFTVATTKPGTCTMYIKNMGATTEHGGNDTWTGQLAERIKSNPDECPGIRLDGPYGRLGCKIEKYEQLILVSGGIGITPMLSMIDSLSKQPTGGTAKSVTFIWVARGKDVVSFFHPIIDDLIQRAAIPIDLHAYVTQADVSAIAWPNATLHAGRPDVSSHVDAVKAKAASAAVYVCGPAALMASTRSAAAKASLHYHEETFEL